MVGFSGLPGQVPEVVGWTNTRQGVLMNGHLLPARFLLASVFEIPHPYHPAVRLLHHLEQRGNGGRIPVLGNEIAPGHEFRFGAGGANAVHKGIERFRQDFCLGTLTAPRTRPGILLPPATGGRPLAAEDVDDPGQVRHFGEQRAHDLPNVGQHQGLGPALQAAQYGPGAHDFRMGSQGRMSFRQRSWLHAEQVDADSVPRRPGDDRLELVQPVFGRPHLRDRLGRDQFPQ